jgi:basic amino acid/polyamine antiporter, APA family
MPETEKITAPQQTSFIQGLGLFDCTMIVAGSMIGSGIFIVSADIARTVGSGGWLLVVWLVTGILTIAAALSYGELAAMMPRAGGQYVYLREAFNPLCGFLYGWTVFLVIQTGTIAAVAVAFAKFLGVLAPAISATNWIIPPINLSGSYAISLSVQQFVAILLVILLTLINTRGLELGKWIQNIFTSAKTLALLALIFIGLTIGRNPDAIRLNFTDFWTPHNVVPIQPELPWIPTLTATAGIVGMLIAVCVAQVGSLFSADAWNNVTFTGSEVKRPSRNIPLALALGTGLVIGLYLLANVAYLCMLPLENIQNARDDRVATAAMATVFSGDTGAAIMAIAIMISTFGCNNGLILAGARVYYAMARDGLFFKSTGLLNRQRVPATGLILQCLWTCLLVLPRTRPRDPSTGEHRLDINGQEIYGNLYGNLLDYVIIAALMFYVLTIVGLFILRRTRPDAERPYRAFGYPIVPALYIIFASIIMVVLLLEKTKTTLPGLVIVALGIPVYYFWKRRAQATL